jgi:hypothetical protein
MENLPVVNLDELLSTTPQNVLENYSMTKLNMPLKAADTYRIYYKDGDFEDVTAENAYLARAASSKDGVVKISIFKASYPDILRKIVEHKLEQDSDKLEVALEKSLGELNFENTERTVHDNFEMLDFNKYSELFKVK